MTRRTFHRLVGAGAASRAAWSQYMLPPQNPPGERFPPSAPQAAELGRKIAQLQESLTALRKKGVADEALVEAEIFHKAAVWIGRYNEYYGKDSAARHSLCSISASPAQSSWKQASLPGRPPPVPSSAPTGPAWTAVPSHTSPTFPLPPPEAGPAAWT